MADNSDWVRRPSEKIVPLFDTEYENNHNNHNNHVESGKSNGTGNNGSGIGTVAFVMTMLTVVGIFGTSLYVVADLNSSAIDRLHTSVIQTREEISSVNNKIDSVNKELRDKIDSVNKDLGNKLESVGNDLSYLKGFIEGQKQKKNTD